MAVQRGSWWLEESKCLQQGQGNGSGELQVSQPHFVPGKEQLILETISSHTKDKRVIRSSQHGFMKEENHASPAWPPPMMKQLAWWKSRVQRTLSFLTLVRLSTQSLITSSDKLAKYGLDKWAVRWTENWLNSQAQRVVISSRKSSWRSDTSGLPRVDMRANIV